MRRSVLVPWGLMKGHYIVSFFATVVFHLVVGLVLTLKMDLKGTESHFVQVGFTYIIPSSRSFPRLFEILEPVTLCDPKRISKLQVTSYSWWKLRQQSCAESTPWWAWLYCWCSSSLQITIPCYNSPALLRGQQKYSTSFLFIFFSKHNFPSASVARRYNGMIWIREAEIWNHRW